MDQVRSAAELHALMFTKCAHVACGVFIDQQLISVACCSPAAHAEEAALSKIFSNHNFEENFKQD